MNFASTSTYSYRTRTRQPRRCADMRKIRNVFLISALAAGAQAQTQHLDFDRPEAWALKYFASSTLLNGLQPPEPLSERPAIGSVTLGLEVGWLPRLNAER